MTEPVFVINEPHWSDTDELVSNGRSNPPIALSDEQKQVSLNELRDIMDSCCKDDGPGSPLLVPSMHFPSPPHQQPSGPAGRSDLAML